MQPDFRPDQPIGDVERHAEITAKALAASLPPTTTVQQDELAANQRRVNLVWELSQATIALGVTFTTLYVAAVLAISDQGQTAAFLLLSNAFFLVIGFYFGRTNHARAGDIQYPGLGNDRWRRDG